MQNNVLSWRDAIRQGFQPGLYLYAADQVPVGVVVARLDFKIWAKKIMGIGCYFSEFSTYRKFRLTVYCSSEGIYRVRDGQIDFASCLIASFYRLIIIKDMKNRVSIQQGEMVELEMVNLKG